MSTSSWGPGRCAGPGAGPRGTSRSCGAASSCASPPASPPASIPARWRATPSAAARNSARPFWPKALWTAASSPSSPIQLFCRALSLKSLRLVSCQGIYDSMRLASVITKFSLLEELELSNCWGAFPETCAAVGKACPLLTRLRLSNKRFIKRDQNVVGGEARAIATTMPALRSLQLFANRLGNRGLVAILDGCPRLESLDIRHCFNVVMDDDMRARCSRIQTLRLPRDSTDDYDLDFSSPDMDPPGERRHLAVFYDDEWEFSSR
ncbi:putative F-box/LRR-repeat protein 23 isoform X2 [Brachypodium distachyon]|uniref:putative F-box/LRR-repeat protein 23 isoform X2 n=1 Tax=Brachypodium distachyon TaxID=15368 RepID=UPI000D0D871D|nr:putative F-box/LRR-repeat protein 23 isoform X2 [Brachypodium distachyon]|eukprot:XP_024311679.1 putative F-box/LRR-repeat protein 23 isoform X2 [Brachypodium distachyon]